MKSVLMSIHPKHCRKISSGEKTIEFRRNAPKIPCPYPIYIHETKKQYVKWQRGATTSFGYGSGKVIGWFFCESKNTLFWDSDIRYHEYLQNTYPKDRDVHMDYICRRGCLSFQELKDYANGKDITMLYIEDPILFDKPRDLQDFLIKTNGRDCADSNADKNCRNCKRYRSRDCFAEFDVAEFRPLFFAPQNFVYVEDIGQ